MSCESLAVTRLSLNTGNLRDLLGHSKGITATRNWLQKRFGVDFYARQYGNAYKFVSSRGTVTVGPNGASIEGEIADEREQEAISKFLSDLNVLVKQEKMAATIRSRYMVVSDTYNAKRQRVMHVNVEVD